MSTMFRRARRYRNVAAYLSLVAFSCSRFSIARADLLYTFTDLGTLGGTNSEATGINNFGQVVGTSTDSSGKQLPFIWSPSLGMQSLGTPSTQFAFGTATSINDNQIVAGYFWGTPFVFPNTFGSQAFSWTANSGYNFLEPSSNQSLASSINAQGDVVGSVGSIQAREWPSGGSGVGFAPIIGGWPNSATSINNSGYTVGWVNFGSITTGILWSPDRSSADIPTLGNANHPNQINNLNQIVGSSTLASNSGTSHAYLASSIAILDLGTLGGQNSEALAINDHGTVVGKSMISDNDPGHTHAFVYTNQMVDLNTKLASPSSSGYLSVATAINNAGQIVGIQTNVAGQNHAVLLTPTVMTQTVIRVPDSTLTNVNQTSGSLLVYKPGFGFLPTFSKPGTLGYVDPNLPTVVLTHGFITDPSMWNQFAHDYPGAGTTLNVVAWDWSGEANRLNVGDAASRTLNEGKFLGNTLRSQLGTAYDQPIHFIGHSLGTLVNAEAVNIFDASPGAGSKTQVTIFDDAAVANEFSSSGIFAASIPKVTVAQIDNYVSAFGMPQTLPNVVNVMLDYFQSPTLLGLHNDYLFHKYPTDWYDSTLPQNSTNSGVGYAWAIDNNFAVQPSKQYYKQSSAPENPLKLVPISLVEADAIIKSRNGTLQEGFVVNQLFTAGNLLNSIISKVGNVTPGFVGSNHAFQLVLGGAAQSSLKEATMSSVTPPTASPSFAWVQAHIPGMAQSLSFDFTYNSVDPNDLLIVGINDTQLFALEGEFVSNGMTFNSGQLDISAWAGQDVEIFFGSTGIAGNGTMTVDNLSFQGVPEPASGGLLILSIVLFLRRQRRLN